MIELKGSVSRKFSLNANPQYALTLLAEVERTISWMPNVSYDQKSDDGIHRLKYGSRELGMYDVSVFCDVREVLNLEKGTYQLVPAVSKTMAPVQESVNSEFARTTGTLTVDVLIRSQGSGSHVTFKFGVHSKYSIDGYSWFAEKGIEQMMKPLIVTRLNSAADQFVKNVQSAYAQAEK